jgi:hypothetical protein
MGAHPDDYKANLPLNSYINVEDFHGPKELAEYLKYLDANDEEYNKYMEWKGTGEMISGHYMCRVCAMTHYADLVPPPPRTETFNFENVSKNHLCLPAGRTFWNNSRELPPAPSPKGGSFA